MYIGLGQVVGGYNPCGQGYMFVNFQCVRDPNCDFSGGSGIGVCPDGYRSVAIGTPSDPASVAEVQTVAAHALAQVATESIAPVQTAPAAITPTPVTPSTATTAAAATGIPWLVLAGVAGAALLLYSGR